MPYDEDGEFFGDQSTPRASLTFTLQGHEPEALAEAVVAKIAKDRAEHIKLLLDQRIEKRVKELVNDAIVDQITAHVKKLLDEGFQPTNSYGYKDGARKTVGEMILDALKPSSNGGYSSTKTLPAIISDTVRRDFDREIVTATSRLKGIVDKEISEQLNTALRSALNLK